MSQSTSDDPDDEDDDREDPDPSDQDADDEDDASETIPCPICHKPVYEGADICPHCGNFITFDDVRAPRKRWVLIGIVLALAAAIMAGVAFTVRGAQP